MPSDYVFGCVYHSLPSFLTVVAFVAVGNWKWYSFVAQNRHGIDANIIQSHDYDGAGDDDDDDEWEEDKDGKNLQQNTSVPSFAKYLR